MTSSGEKCGLSSLLPMSCRERAEAFARHLHSRLTSLGSEETDSIVNENSWLGPHENSLTLSQPKHTSDNDLYVDFNTLESPGSPEAELDAGEIERLINKDNLILFHETQCQYTTAEDENLGNRVTSNDSDETNVSSSEEACDSLNVTDKCNGITQNGVISKPNENELPNEDADKKDEATSTDSFDDTYILGYHEEKITVNGNDTYPYPSSSTDNELTPECPHILEALVNETDTQKNCVQTDDEDTELKERIPFVELPPECPNILEELVNEADTRKNCVQTDDEDNELEERIPRVRRCSSLKTGKTPPGTPGQKKIVRFADVMGLDLADVRTFLDEIPKVPTSAYDDLKDADLKASSPDSSSSDSMSGGRLKVDTMLVEKILAPLFQQPGGQPDFIDRLREKQVCLDNAMVVDNVTLSIRGIVRVKNLDFHKSVHVRYSLDSWQSFADVQAVYVENSCDGFSDKFSFLLYCNSLKIGQTLEFAVRFQCKGCQYWDNNFGKNYCFQCLPATNHISCTSAPACNQNWDNFYY